MSTSYVVYNCDCCGSKILDDTGINIDIREEALCSDCTSDLFKQFERELEKAEKLDRLELN